TRRTLVTLITMPVVALASYAAAALMTVNTVMPDAPTKPPQFDVDPAWPKPLPNRWLMGQAAGVAVDRHDHIWVIQRPKTLTDADTKHLNAPAGTVVDPQTNELFVADGYGNHRVIVFDAQTGAYKRHWGANGRPPGDPSVKSFRNPVHCVRLSRDGLLYVCDRANNRMQVFKKDGKFVKELVVAQEL